MLSTNAVRIFVRRFHCMPYVWVGGPSTVTNLAKNSNNVSQNSTTTASSSSTDDLSNGDGSGDSACCIGALWCTGQNGVLVLEPQMFRLKYREGVGKLGAESVMEDSNRNSVVEDNSWFGKKGTDRDGQVGEKVEEVAKPTIAKPKTSGVGLDWYKGMVKQSEMGIESPRNSKERHGKGQGDLQPSTSIEKIVEDFSDAVSNTRTNRRRKDALATFILSKSNELSAKSVARIFNSCARGGFLAASLFSGVCESILGNQQFVQAFKPSELCSTMGALGALLERKRKRNREILTLDAIDNLDDSADLMDGPRLRENEFFPWSSTFFRVLMEEFVARGDVYSESDIAAAVSGIGVWFQEQEGLPPQDDVQRIVDFGLGLITSPSHLDRTTPSQLAGILHACAIMNCNVSDYLVFVCDEVETKLRSRIEFGPRDLSSILSALSRLRMRHVGALTALSDEISERAWELNGDGLSKVIHGLGRLGFRDAKAVARVLSEMMMPRRLQSITKDAYPLIVDGLHRLDYRDRAVLEQLCGEITRQRVFLKFTERELNTVLDGFQGLGYNGVGLSVLRRQQASR